MARFERYFECHCRPGDPGCPHKPDDPEYSCPNCGDDLQEQDQHCASCGWMSFVCRSCGDIDLNAVVCIDADLNRTFVCQSCIDHTLRIVCAWCRVVLGEKRAELARPGGAVSHGICPTCAAEFEKQMFMLELETLAS